MILCLSTSNWPKSHKSLHYHGSATGRLYQGTLHNLTALASSNERVPISPPPPNANIKCNPGDPRQPRIPFPFFRILQQPKPTLDPFPANQKNPHPHSTQDQEILTTNRMEKKLLPPPLTHTTLSILSPSLTPYLQNSRMMTKRADPSTLLSHDPRPRPSTCAERPRAHFHGWRGFMDRGVGQGVSRKGFDGSVACDL